MIRSTFQANQRAFMKHVFVLIAIILMLVSEVYAKDDKWIDGIRFRYASIYNTIDFMLEIGEEPLMRVEPGYRHLENQQSLPIAIVLPETLMNSWSFRGGVFEWSSTEVTDLVPSNGARQTSSQRTILYNDFFNASDKAFADANPNWALTADFTGSRIFYGYVWGVFIPAFENHRFLKAGIGPGIFAADISYKLNLCSEYKITTIQNQNGGRTGKDVECIDKKEIDTASWNGYGLGSFFNFTVWERFTKDSIWRILTTIGGSSLEDPEPKLKNHNKNLKTRIGSQIIEFISYTYRF